MKRVIAAAAAAALAPAAAAQEPVKIGIVTFLSGPAAAPFGVPAKNAAEFVIEELNAGKVPAPYAKKGFGGAPLEMVIVDEAGSTTTQVTEFRNLVQRQNVDLIVGYVSSGNCLAIAPVAEELKKLTNFFDCGTPRIFEDASYKYVFRTSPTATMDSVGAALYVKDAKPGVKSIAGLNQNYAWGQDSWGDFELAMKVLVPNVEVKTSQMPKLFAGQYNAEISALLSGKPDVIHSSFWDGDLEALILQAGPRGLMKQSLTILTTGETAMHKLGPQIPDGTVLGARGPFGPYAPSNPYNKWFHGGFVAKYKGEPNYASYQMAQAILGVKLAWEKAQESAGGKKPTNEQVAAALEHLNYEGPGGPVKMAIGKGHQAIMETAYGTTKLVNGKLTLVNVKRYPAEKVNPPEGMKSADWIKSGFKPQ
ncbi:MAG: ABC transporter substrate-binding protein [Betaproteobacteria bacterium]|nr:MAG: ABC transporter substrate-binding protein [Betaproteobacteria bacterium]